MGNCVLDVSNGGYTQTMREKYSSLYNYDWYLSKSLFTKDKGTVFSCFACGGGSTMGYKLAGFDVVGCNEIDKRMMDVYIKNHNPYQQIAKAKVEGYIQSIRKINNQQYSALIHEN